MPITNDILRERLAAMREQLDTLVNNLHRPLCEHESEAVAFMYAKADETQAYLDKWARLKEDLDNSWDSVHPIVAEYLDDTFALLGLTEREPDEHG